MSSLKNADKVGLQKRELLLATDVVKKYLGPADDFDHDDDAVHGSTDRS